MSTQAEAFYNEEHRAMQKTLRKIIDDEINPNVEQWEKDGDYPAQKVFKTLGKVTINLDSLTEVRMDDVFQVLLVSSVSTSQWPMVALVLISSSTWP